MAKGNDVTWLAGLLEGEGSFGAWRTGRAGRRFPRIQLGMTDRDVVARAARLMGARCGGPYRSPSYGAKCKPAFRMSVGGTRAVVWMKTLYPHLGRRRKAQVRLALTGRL